MTLNPGGSSLTSMRRTGRKPNGTSNTAHFVTSHSHTHSQSGGKALDGETEQVCSSKEKEGRNGKDQNISRYPTSHVPLYESFRGITITISRQDNAYACDGRVKRFKEAEKAAKVARRRAREEAARQESMQLEQVGFSGSLLCLLEQQRK